MGKEQIISKGKYTRQQPSGLIAAKQYIFVKNEEGQRRLLLRLANEGHEVCTSFAFVVSLSIRRHLASGKIAFSSSTIFSVPTLPSLTLCEPHLGQVFMGAFVVPQ